MMMLSLFLVCFFGAFLTLGIWLRARRQREKRLERRHMRLIAEALRPTEYETDMLPRRTA